MHPLLLPGSHLLRRSDGHLQVGLRREHAVAVTGSERPLSALASDVEAMARLIRAGSALPDDRLLRSALPAATEEPWAAWQRHTVAALARRCPGRLAAAVTGRSSHKVLIRPFGHPVAEQLADDLLELCRRSGLSAAAPRRSGRRSPGRRSGQRSSGQRGSEPLMVLVGAGEPSRDIVDPLLQEGVAHLLVRLVEGEALIGPLVVPGRTACLRCIDAYLTEQDPSWPLLVEQYARATSTDRADGIPEPVDAALAAVATGWAARDAASYVEGGTPTSWSATVRLSAGLDVVESRSWPTHPSCGCTWA